MSFQHTLGAAVSGEVCRIGCHVAMGNILEPQCGQGQGVA